MVKWFFSTILVSIFAAWVDLVSLQVIDYTYACGWLRTNRLQHFFQCGKLMMRWLWYWLEFSDLLSIIICILCAAHVAATSPDQGHFLSSLWTHFVKVLQTGDSAKYFDTLYFHMDCITCLLSALKMLFSSLLNCFIYFSPFERAISEGKRW